MYNHNGPLTQPVKCMLCPCTKSFLCWTNHNATCCCFFVKLKANVLRLDKGCDKVELNIVCLSFVRTNHIKIFFETNQLTITIINKLLYVLVTIKVRVTVSKISHISKKRICKHFLLNLLKAAIKNIRINFRWKIRLNRMLFSCFDRLNTQPIFFFFFYSVTQCGLEVFPIIAQ
jgi:hypothetical protein